MIYVPNKEQYKCVVVQSEGVIRAYEEKPRNNTTVNYRDFYIKSDYIYKDGSQQFSSYANLPICLQEDIITSDFYYRVDLADILIIFTIFSIFIIYIPLKILFRFFKRFRL